MKFSLLYIFLFLATVLSGLLAGETIDRLIIGVKAWRDVPIQSWALYSRHADLSIRGALIYPVEAIGSFILLMGAFIVVVKDKTRMNITIPLAIAILFSFLGLFFTFFAAPWMLRLRSSGDEPAVLQNIFDHFYFWSTWRGIVQILSFPFCLWATTQTSNQARAF